MLMYCMLSKIAFQENIIENRVSSIKATLLRILDFSQESVRDAEIGPGEKRLVQSHLQGPNALFRF